MIATIRKPLYQQVYEQIRERITSGIYGPGASLPSEQRLSEEFGVSLITVRRSLQELELDSLVEKRQGSGNIVRSTARSLIIGLSSFSSDVAAGRLHVVRTLLLDEIIPAGQTIAEKLDLQPGSMLRHLLRMDSEGGVPYSIDDVYVPPVWANAITPDIASSPLFAHLLQARSGVDFVRTDYEFSVEMPSLYFQDLLHIAPDVPLLVTGEAIFDASGRAVLWIVSRYSGDHCRLSGSVMLVQKVTESGPVGE